MNEDLDFAREMQQHLVEWEYDGKFILIHGFPEGATVLPDDFHDALLDEWLFPSGSSGLAWTKKTGWVGLSFCGELPIVWYIQKQQSKVDLAAVREKFKDCF